MNHSSTDYLMSIFVEGEESYDCQKEMNKIPISSDQSHLSDLYSPKYIHRDVINIQPSHKRDQLTHKNTTYELDHYFDSESNFDDEKDDKNNTPQNSSTEPNEQKQDSIKKTSKYQKKIDKKPKGKSNNCDSKNFFLFLWKKIINRLNDTSKTDDETNIIDNLTTFNGSMDSLNILFSCELLKNMTEKMFRQKYFNRCIMISSIKTERKKRYLDYVRRVETCYHKDKRIDYLR